LAGGSLFTPGEAPPPPNRTVTVELRSARVRGRRAERRLQLPASPDCPGSAAPLVSGRLPREAGRRALEPFLNDFGTPNVFARFSFRVR
jgi:hypothetical protein